LFRGPGPAPAPGPAPSPSSPPPRAATNAALFSFFASLANSLADFSFSLDAPSLALGLAGFALVGLGWDDSPLLFVEVVVLPGVVGGVEADADAVVEVDTFIAVAVVDDVGDDMTK
jgi:hypothetical protein